jgi:N-acetylneuraminate synthase
MLRRLQLDEEAHARIVHRCEVRGIEFLSTPFDDESLDLLTRRFDMRRLKLGSGELTNAPLLLKAARTGRPLILSTGMATLGEVEEALAVVAFGYREAERHPTRGDLDTILSEPSAQRALRERVVLLHCTTEYPTPAADVNLRAMDTLRAAFGLDVGYSDHTAGISIAIAAAARGAAVIEKHFTIDRTLPGPDHQASLEPGELAAMVHAVREVEEALGDGIKRARPIERKNMVVARKSLVAARPIAKGEIFTEQNVAAKRPGGKLSPMLYWDLLGRPAPRAFDAEEALEP